jgi:predicted PurR-regulated permease PerM
VVVLFFLLRDRAVLARGMRRVLPLSDAEVARVTGRAADSVQANLYANVITSLLDAVGAGVVFWAVGLPAPVLWGAVTFVVTLLPLVGSAGVWVPAATYLALTGRWMPAAVIAMWGVATWALVDHILYVRLVGGRLRMHPLLLLIAILGGLALFGASGLVLGPGIVAVTEAFLDIWESQAGPELEPAQRASMEPPKVATRFV